MGTVQKESAETQYWIELLIESGIDPSNIGSALLVEASKLVAIFTSIGKKLKE